MTAAVSSWFVEAFRRQADGLAGFYGAKIWLVGSALTKEFPRDIDVRVVLSAYEMARRYGPQFPEIVHGRFTDWQWRRAVDCVKQSRSLMAWGGFPIDFQIQSEAEALPYSKKPSVRLDSAPDWVLVAFDDRF